MQEPGFFTRVTTIALFLCAINLISNHLSNLSQMPLVPGVITPLVLSFLFFYFSIPINKKLGDAGKFIYATAAGIYLISLFYPNYPSPTKAFSLDLQNVIFPLTGVYAAAEIISRLLDWLLHRRSKPEWNQYFNLSLLGTLLVSNPESPFYLAFLKSWLTTLGAFVIGHIGMALLYALFDPQKILTKFRQAFNAPPLRL